MYNKSCTVVDNTKSTQKVKKSEIKFWVIDSRIIIFNQNSKSFEHSEFFFEFR